MTTVLDTTFATPQETASTPTLIRSLYALVSRLDLVAWRHTLVEVMLDGSTPGKRHPILGWRTAQPELSQRSALYLIQLDANTGTSLCLTSHENGLRPSCFAEIYGEMTRPIQPGNRPAYRARQIKLDALSDEQLEQVAERLALFMPTP